jgi:cytochrome oxidase Cu insertion factor (SCO1/SenC/PrrC family)
MYEEVLDQLEDVEVSNETSRYTYMHSSFVILVDSLIQ